MKKKIKSNLFNEFKEKVLSGGNYAYVYDKEDSSLTDAAFNAFSDINDWKAETLDACTASTTNVSTDISNINGWKDSWTTNATKTNTSDKTITITGTSDDIIGVVLAFCNRLLPALEGGLKNKETVRNTTASVKSILLAIQGTLKEQLKDFVNAISMI